jgi:hypothetical protein
MRSTEARQRAIECGMRARAARDDVSRDFYRQMREVWLDLAAECDRWQAADEASAETGQPLH